MAITLNTNITGDAGTTSGSVSWPSGHAANDVGFLFVETDTGDSVATPSGWTLIGHAETSAGSFAGVRLTAFWRRATSSSMSAATFSDPGNHYIAIMVVYRGCVTTGDPYDSDITPVWNTQTTGGTTTTWPSAVTTQYNQSWPIWIAANEVDSTSLGWTSASNSVFGNVGGNGMVASWAGINGNGGQIMVLWPDSGTADPPLAASQSTGSTTASTSTTTQFTTLTLVLLENRTPPSEPKESSDTATATDAAVSIQQDHTAADTTAATDATVSLQQDYTTADTAAATDAVVSVTVTGVTAADVAAATDATVTLQQDHVAADTATATDAAVSIQQDHIAADIAAATDVTVSLQQDHTAADTAAATDTTVALQQDHTAADVVSAAEIADASNTAVGADTAAATDATVDLQQDHTAADTVAATEDAWLSQKEMTDADVVAAVDLVDPVDAEAVAADVVAAAEDANASTAVDAPTDTVTGIDAPVQVDLIAEDQGTAVDSAFVSDQVLATQGDSVAAVDSVSLVDVSTDASDSATGTDSTTLLNQEELGADTATGADAVVSLVIEVADVASGTDGAVLAVFLPTQSDTVTAEDSPILSAEDSITAVETAFLFIEGQGLQAPRAHHVESDRRQQRVGSSRSEQLVRIKAERRMTVIGTTPHVTL